MLRFVNLKWNKTGKFNPTKIDTFDILTKWLMNMLVRVKNNVAKRPSLPGIELGGITKLT